MMLPWYPRQKSYLLKTLHPQIFGTAAYDGRKNLYSAARLPFENDSQEYQLTLDSPPASGTPGREPKTWRIRLTKTHQEINPEILQQYVQGQLSYNNDVAVAINALNVAVAMLPGENSKYSSYGKSVLIPDGSRDIGSGLSLWRGYFQSIRPTMGKMIINVDITTALMFRSGPLMEVALDFFRRTGQHNFLNAPMNEHDRRALSKFLFKVRITTTHVAGAGGRSRGIQGILNEGAATKKFIKEGKTLTIQQYYETTYRKKLNYPKAVLVQIGPEVWLPIEVCVVVAGQPRREQPPPELTKEMVEFATKKPQERLADIRLGLQRLGYGQSAYLRAFGATINTQELTVPARVLNPPKVVYAGQKTVMIGPGTGSWSMGTNKFLTGSQVRGWAIVIFARKDFWPAPKIDAVRDGFARACTSAGITGLAGPGVVYHHADPNRPVSANLQEVGRKFGEAKRPVPSLLLLILPNNSSDLYKQIKHFGDVKNCIATQCVLESKVYNSRKQEVAGSQYFLNLALKVNVKLGGINTAAHKADTSNILGDPANLTLIMGADAQHPAPGSQDRPSFTAVIGSVDSLASKYVATHRAQRSKKEIIEDMEDMTKELIERFKSYNQKLPKRIIMYRDGVSEGQFAQVIELEIPKIKAACRSCGFTEPPKLTFIVVGKRHHIRFFPDNPANADRSGNCLAGTIVDQGITHPVEFDWYLLSHSGLLGTSRPAHYSVLLDENNMPPDTLQQLTYALCHVYARCTRSVSIPAPTYYADIVCERSANHYDPGTFSDDQSSSGPPRTDLIQAFRPAHRDSYKFMYFT